MIIHNPVITGSLQVNGTSVSSIDQVDNISGSVVTLTDASASLAAGKLNNTTDTLTGDLTVTGKITAQEFHTEYTSASIVYQSGSTKFGDSSDDIHQFTGSLDVVTSDNIPLKLSSSDSGAKIRLSDPDNDVFIQNQTGLLSLGFSATQNGQIMHISSSGIIGIGTSSPNHKLTIDESTTASYILSSRNTTDNLQIKLGTTTGAYANIQSSKISDNSAYFLSIQADGGNLGVGTTQPPAKLTVRGSSGAISGTGISYIDNIDDAFALVVNNNGNSAQNDRGVFDARVAGSSVFRINNSGNVGIGTTDVNAKLRVVGGDVVVTGGKLGIGISSPRADITVDHVIDTLPNNTVDDTDAWNNTEKSHVFLEGTNNAMAIGISGGNNTRRGWLQVGHNNTSFANATGRLLLQPLGGLVGIGLYDAETPLHIKAATAEIKLESSDTGGGAGDVLGGIDIWGNDFSGTGRDSRAYIKAVYEDVFARTALTFGVGPYNTTATETVRFPSTGGITFNGDTAAANALDDYEEGTWTPSFGNASSTVSVSHSYSVYTKIGNKITVNTRIVNVDTSSFSSSDTVYVHGLPYTSSTRSYAPVYLRTSNTDSVKMVAVEASSTYFTILDTTMADFVSSATDIWITLTYFV